MSVRRRVERLEAQNRADEVPWWTLRPGVEPDWPRPLMDLSDTELEMLWEREIDAYCAALEEGTGYHATPHEDYIQQEAFHELRWRQYGIARRASGMPEPSGWREVLAEQLAEKTKERS